MWKRSALILVELTKGQKSFGELTGIISNRATLSRSLRELIAQGLISKTGGGYELTPKGSAVAEKVADVMRMLRTGEPDVERIPHPIYRDLLRRYFELLSEKLGDRLESVVLFGSVARGTWRKDSDLDLLVVAEGFEDPMRALDELIPVVMRLKKTPEYSLALKEGFYPNIQHYPLSRAELAQLPRILLDVAHEGVVIYDRGGFSRAAELLRKRLEETGSYRVEIPGGEWYWVLGAEEI
jgi:predicted nucleotidyltransferase/DNA-binding HxlR family transcriptional regulator